VIDRLFIEAQPGHIQYAAHGAFESGQRDLLRAQLLRTEFASLGPPDFNVTGRN
jgi:protein arginine kinase